MSLTFLRFNAPDLALTQLTVEVVTIVLLLMCLRYLPGKPAKQSSASRRLRDGTTRLGDRRWRDGHDVCHADAAVRYDASYHMANAKPGGGGTNVVNVILVDFRGYDTLGEIRCSQWRRSGFMRCLQACA